MGICSILSGEVFLLGVRVSCSPGLPLSHCVAEAGFELSASHELDGNLQTEFLQSSLLVDCGIHQLPIEYEPLSFSVSGVVVLLFSEL